MGKTFTRILYTFFLLMCGLFYSFQAAAQCSAFNNTKNLFFNQPRVCAPSDVFIGAEFGSLSNLDESTIKIEIDWGNGDKQTFPVKEKVDGSGQYLYYIENITYTYPRDGQACNYDILVRPVINGSVCTIELSATATVWDTDNMNGGEIFINPDVYYICAGEEAMVTFEDHSIWNCTPPVENTTMNWNQRWTQFIYGTSATAGPRIANVQVGGAVRGYPYAGTIEEHLPDPDNNPPSPSNVSLPVYVPSTAQVGERFEITLRNWNGCNPYDDVLIAGTPANAADGDHAPVLGQALIIVIDKPSGAITTKNKDNQLADDFCPDEKVVFEGAQTNAAISSSLVGWKWEIYDNATGSGSPIKTSTNQNFSFNEGFSSPGQKLVRLYVSNTQSSTGNCKAAVEKVINVIAPPTISSTINGSSDNPLQVCFDASAPDFNANYAYSLYSENNYRYRFGFFTANSAASTPDSYSSWTSAAAGSTQTPARTELYNQPGVYRIWMEVEDLVTGCSTVEEKQVVIYDVPQADFTSENLCVGQESTFKSLTPAVQSIQGDKIISYAWDINYDAAAGFSADYTGSELEIKHTYTASGTYQVALQVSTQAGCTDLLVKEVEIYPAPQAQLSSNYTAPICPADVITFTNTSATVNTATLFPNGVNYRVFVIDLAQPNNPTEYALTNDAVSIPFFNNTSVEKVYEVWLEARAAAPNSCAAASVRQEIRVKPGAQLGFYEPTFNPLAANCSPKTLELHTTQATQDLLVDRYIWSVYRNSVFQYSVSKVRGEENFEKLTVNTENSSTNYANYTIQLEAEKGSICLSPATNTYGISPKPSAEFTITELESTCEETIFQVQVLNPEGIKNYAWDFFPVPKNSATLNADDSFELIYDRPDENAAGFLVEASLTAENTYGCFSDEVSKTADVLAQQITNIGLNILTPPPYESCSPFTVDFENTTSAPTGTNFALIIRKGTGDEQEVTPESGSLDGQFAYTFTEAGSYRVTLRASAPDGCTRFYTFPDYVVVLPDAEPFFDLDVKEGCGPLEVGFIKNITAARHRWTIRNKATSEVLYQQEFNPSSSDDLNFFRFENTRGADQLYEVELWAETENGCAADSTLEVLVHPQPQAALELVSDANVCQPYELTIRNNSPAVSGTIYTVYWGDGTSQEMSTPELTHTYSNSSFTNDLQYQVKLVAQNAQGCKTESSLPVTVKHQLQASYTADRFSGCAPLFVNLSNNSQGHDPAQGEWLVREVGAETYTNLGTSISNYTFENTGTTAKKYQLKYLARSSDAACAVGYEREFTVYPQADAAFEVAPAEGCAGYTVTVSNLSLQEGVQYHWNWGDGETSISDHTQAELTHTYENTSYTNTRKFTISLSAQNGSACETFLSKEVVVYPAVLADASVDVQEGCAPLRPYFTNRSRGATSHNWELLDADGQLLDNQTTSLPSFAPLENSTSANLSYTIRYTAGNAQGCSDVQEFDFTVYPEVKAEFEASNAGAVCGPATITFTHTNPQPSVRYIWSWGDGSPNDTTATEESIQHTFFNNLYDRSRNYEVRLTAENTVTNCRLSFSRTITVRPTMSVAVKPDKTEGCAPLDVQFSNNSQNISTHRWFARLQGSSQEMEVQSSADASFSFSNSSTTPQVYEVVYVGSTAEGCSEEEIHQITVYPELAPSFTTDSVQVRLPNASFQIENTTPNADSWTTNWDFGDGSSSTEVQPGTHTFPGYGTYTIRLRISNGYCSETVEQQVRVLEILPIVDFESIPVAGCSPLTVQFHNQSQFADTTTYLWSFGEGEGYSREVNPSYTFYRPGEYTVTLSASNPSGEAITQSHNIVTVYDQPRADFSLRESLVYVPDEPVYVANHSLYADQFYWDFGDGTTYEEREPVHYYQEPGKYTISLIARNQWGCADTLVRQEVVTAEGSGTVKIPNAFTPSPFGPRGGLIDGSGDNDVFYPVLKGGVVSYHLRIYNRWGELMFETRDKNYGWDGYYKGSLCKADVYVYKLNVEFVDGQTKNEIGDVTLIR